MSILKIIFVLKVTGSRLKVEPGYDHDVAQQDHGSNMCVKFKLLPLYSVSQRFSPDKLADAATRLPICPPGQLG